MWVALNNLLVRIGDFITGEGGIVNGMAIFFSNLFYGTHN